MVTFKLIFCQCKVALLFLMFWNSLGGLGGLVLGLFLVVSRTSAASASLFSFITRVAIAVNEIVHHSSPTPNFSGPAYDFDGLVASKLM